jgi:hypothetical protein
VYQIRSYIRSKIETKHRGYGDTFYIDEVFVKINGKQHYLWRAVDQDGEVVDVYLQAKRRDFWVLMLPFTTCSILGAISFEQSTIEISGKVRSQNGVGQWLEASSSELLVPDF